MKFYYKKEWNGCLNKLILSFIKIKGDRLSFVEVKSENCDIFEEDSK